MKTNENFIVVFAQGYYGNRTITEVNHSEGDQSMKSGIPSF